MTTLKSGIVYTIISYLLSYDLLRNEKDLYKES